MKNKKLAGLKIKTWLSVIIVILAVATPVVIGYYHRQTEKVFEKLSNTAVLQAHANTTIGEYRSKWHLQGQQEIISYIIEVFGQDAPKALKLLECENPKLDPNAVNDNEKSGLGKGQDIGIFQISNFWQRTQNKFLHNWKVNIEIAHQLYLENGKSFKLWTCGKQL